MKHCPIALFLWMFGGFFGLHHFYLGRDKQGFLWATSCGGFVIGWIRDFFCLRTYTEEANRPYPTVRRRPYITANLHRVVGILMFSSLYSTIIENAIPVDEMSENVYFWVKLLLTPLGTAFGAYMVSNVGRICCRWTYPLIGAYAGEVLFGSWHLLMESHNGLMLGVVVVAAVALGWRMRRGRREDRNLCLRAAIWAGMGALVLSLWFSYGYYNAEIYIEETNETLKVRKLFVDFLNSPAWEELRRVIADIITVLWESNGDYDEAWRTLSEGVAVSQIRHAKKTLRFEDHSSDVRDITEEVLKKHYRELAKEWHPDHHQGNMKKEAQEKFIEIKRSYELLKVVINKSNRKSQ